MLYNENMACMLLGSIFKQTDLLFQPNYPLDKTDFEENQFHRIMFVVAVKLGENGIKEVTPIEAENFLKSYPSQLEIANDSNFFEFIETTKELSSQGNYELYYNTIRKFSLLRELKAQGIEINRWYDGPTEVEANAKLNQFTIKDILSELENSQAKLRSKYDVDFVREEECAGSNIEELLAEFDEAPAFGAFRSSPYLTQLFMGLNKGHLQMHSAPSSVGKSRYSAMDLSYLSANRMWDEDSQDFIINKNYSGSGLYIFTEMNLRREVKPLFLSAISGVPYNVITKGLSSKEERERILEAGKIMEECNLFLVDMPDFTSSAIDRKIHEYVDNYGTENVIFDYLQLNSPLAEEYKNRNGGVPSREDLVIRSLATDLKAYAEKYNVRLITSSQLNGTEKSNDFPDESCLSSAKSIKQKLDGGCIFLSAKDRPKELKLVEPYMSKIRKGLGEDRTPMPNLITYVYKSRFGEYADQKLKIFSYFDRGLMRIKDYCVLDNRNNIVSLPKPVIKGE